MDQSVKQAQTLIGDLLAYSCLDRESKPASPASCRDAVNAAMNNLQALIADSNAQVECQELPMVICDGAQLVQLFENLIGNAVKYRRHKAPQVEISAQQQDHDWVFCVADNGIGIDAANYDKVFDIFKRLHTRDEYPGTGIGLAICRKIVERHGGSIWVESEQGRGSRFYFRLPGREQ